MPTLEITESASTSNVDNFSASSGAERILQSGNDLRAGRMDVARTNAAASKCMSHVKHIKALIAQGPQKAVMPHNLEWTAFKMLGRQSASRKFVDGVVKAEAILKSLSSNLVP